MERLLECVYLASTRVTFTKNTFFDYVDVSSIANMNVSESVGVRIHRVYVLYIGPIRRTIT